MLTHLSITYRRSLALPEVRRRRDMAWERFYASLADGSNSMLMRAYMRDWFALDDQVRAITGNR